MPPTYRPESRKTRGMEPGVQNRMLQAGSWPEKLIQLWWGTKVGGKAQYVAENTAGGYLGASTRPPDYKRLVLVPCSCESNDVIRPGKLGKGVVVLVSSQLHEPLFVNHIHHPYVSQDL